MGRGMGIRVCLTLRDGVTEIERFDAESDWRLYAWGPLRDWSWCFGWGLKMGDWSGVDRLVRIWCLKELGSWALGHWDYNWCGVMGQRWKRLRMCGHNVFVWGYTMGCFSGFHLGIWGLFRGPDCLKALRQGNLGIFVSCRNADQFFGVWMS